MYYLKIKNFKLKITLFVLFIIFCIVPTNNADAAILVRPPSNLGLVGYWPMDEKAGTVAGDSSGQRNNGTITGATWTSGKRGGALSFNGIDAYVNIPDTGTILDFTNTNLYTWSQWLNITSTSTIQCFIAKDGPSASSKVSGFNICLNPTGSTADVVVCKYALTTDSVPTCSTGLNLNIAPNQWASVAVTYDGASNWGVYLNGVYKGSMVLSALSDTSASYYIGAGQKALTSSGVQAPGLMFSGKIDDVRVYNRVLTAEEISKMYKSGQVVAKTVGEGGLVGYWSLNDGGGAVAGDSSGNNNHGTITGATWVGGRFGEGLNFSARTQYANIANTSAVADNLANFTVSNWFKMSATASNYGNVMVSKISGLGAGNGWAVMEFNNSGKYSALLQSSNGAAWVQKVTTATFNDNRWHHGVSVFSNNTITMYIDGQAVAQGYSNTGTLGSYTNTSDIRIGNDFTSEGFLGSLDDVRIYNRALSADEVQNLYKQNETMVNAPQNDKLTNGLVGFWSFNGKDVSGATAYDRSGQGNNGTISGATLDAGKVGQGMSLSGTNQEINMGTILPSPTAFTLSLWINPTTSGQTNKGVMGTWQNSTGYMLWMTSGKIACPVNASPHLTGNTTLSANTWYHVVCTWDGTNATIYVNGNTDGSPQAESSPISSLGVFFIGEYGSASGLGYNFAGNVDEGRVYNRALSASEVKQLYNMGK